MTCFVLTIALLAAPPAQPGPAGAPLALAEDALAGGDLAGATARAERALAASPEDARALQLLAALYERAGAPGASDLRRRAGPPKALPLPPQSDLKAGETAHVVAPMVTLRHRPAAGAPSAGWLPWGASVAVDGVDGEFARIRQPRLARGPNTLEMASLDAAARPAGKAERDPKAWERVWVHRSFLSRAPRAPAAVVKEALRAAPKDPEGALQLLDGAGQLAGTDAERAAMVRLALHRGYPAIAVKLAVQPPRGRAAWGSPIAGEVRFLLGCRGKRHVAPLVDAGRLTIDDEGVHDLGDVPDDACLEGFNPFPGCPPLEVDHPYSDYSLDPAQEDDAPEAAEEGADGDEGGEGDGAPGESGLTRTAADEAYQQQLAAHQAEGERLGAELGRLTEAFPDGPWARITLRNTTDGYAPPIWSLRLVVTKREDCEDHRVLTEVAEATPLRIPALPPKATLDLWVQLPEYAGNELQLSLSPEQEDIFLGGASPSEPDCTVLCM